MYYFIKSSQQTYESSGIFTPILPMKKMQAQRGSATWPKLHSWGRGSPGNQNQFLWLWKPYSFHYTPWSSMVKMRVDVVMYLGTVGQALHFPVGRSTLTKQAVVTERTKTYSLDLCWGQNTGESFQKIGKVGYPTINSHSPFSRKMKVTIPCPSLDRCKDQTTKTTSKNFANADSPHKQKVEWHLFSEEVLRVLPSSVFSRIWFAWGEE